MSLKSRLLMLAAAIGLVNGPTRVKIEPGAANGPTRVKVDAKSNVRKFRHGAFTPKGYTTRPSGKRCALCGTGGHSRFGRTPRGAVRHLASWLTDPRRT